MSPTEFTHSPVIPIAAPFDLTDYPELAGINNLTGTGLVARISAGVYATRTLTGTTNQVNVADGNGVAGNPTISLPQNIHTAATPTFAGMTLSGMTAGSVLFAGTSGVVSQDNSNLYWDDSNDRLGIGTASPSAPLDIIKIGVPLYTSNNDPTAGIREYARFVGGNNADGSGARLVFNDNGGYTDARNRGAIGWSRVSSVFGVDVYAGSSLTQAARFTSTPSLLVNTTTDSAHYRLKVNGAGIFGSNLYDANFATLHVGQRPLADSIATIKLNTQTSNRGWHLDVFDDGTTAQYFQIYSSVSAATRLKITHAGNFLFGGATETASSGLIQLATGTTAASGILAGTDTNLYRSAANTWTTDDSLLIAANTYIGATDAVVNRGGSGRIRISKDGTGATTNAGWEVGYLGTGSFSSIWSTLIGTPGITNYAILATASSTQLNAAGAGSGVLVFNIADTPQVRLDDVSGFKIKSDKFVTWTSGVPSAAVDTTIGRNAAGDVAVGTGIAAAKAGALSLTLIKIETGTTASNGIVWGTDTNLYRSAANTLKTDDSLVVSSGLSVSTLTTGSIPCIGTGGAIVDNNANLFWNNGGTALLIRSNSIGTNGALQVNGTVGVGSSGTNYIRPITNADVVSLILLATQVVVGNANSDAYSYSGGSRLAVVTNADSHTLVDIGRNTSTNARFKVVNTTSGQAYTTFENSTITAFRSFTSTGETIFGASSLATGEGRIHVAPHTTKAGGLYFGAANTNLYSSASGALKTDGVLTIAGTTASSSSTTGALIVAGGVGIAKALYVANDLVVTPAASANRAVTITGSNGGNPTIDVSAGSLAITPATVFASTITTIGGATFHTTSTALTNGAGAGAGTLTNAPSAGDPTKWIGINDNGTTRYIPAW